MQFHKNKKEEIINYLSLRVEDKDYSMGLLQFCLTTRCQLSCRYCHMGILPARDMDAKIMKKGMDFVFRSTSDFIAVQFFGGEPLLKWDLLKEGTLYFYKKSKKLKKQKSIALATNGILLDDKKIEFLKQFRRDFKIVFSFDGLFSQNSNRPPFDKKRTEHYREKVFRNIKKLIKSDLDFFVNIVVGPDNFKNLEQNVESLINQGVRSVRLSYMMGIFWKNDDIKDFLTLVKTIYLRYKKQGLLIDIGHCNDEPVVICSGLVLMPDEKLFVGTTYPLLDFFPHIKEYNYYGYLDDYEHAGQIMRNRCKEITKSLEILKDKDEKEFRLLANNIYLGIAYENMFHQLEKE